MASILVVSGPNEGDYYPLGSRAVVIGRDEGCSIQIVDDSVSRRHVQVRLDGADKTYNVQDMKSTNGSFLNDRKITDDVSLTSLFILSILLSVPRVSWFLCFHEAPMNSLNSGCGASGRDLNSGWN